MADGLAAGDAEQALRPLTALAQSALGDRTAHLRPGALKSGERHYHIAGCFMITPDRAYNMLIAGQGFPPEQYRLSIPLNWGHPGQVVESQQPLLLSNIDDHPEFRQFLKTSRMGSSLYAPMIAEGVMVGQIVAAAQARGSFGPDDLEALVLLSHCATALWLETGGPAWLAGGYPPQDQWRAEEHAVPSLPAGSDMGILRSPH